MTSASLRSSWATSLSLLLLSAHGVVAAESPPPQISTEISPAIAEIRRNFGKSPFNVMTLHNAASVYFTQKVEKGDAVWEIPAARRNSLDFTYKFNGEVHKADEIWERNYTNALLIIKDGKIVYERYRNMTNPASLFVSNSIAKSITSILMGIALADGSIKSLDDQVTDYVPELRGTGYDGATLQHLLDMRSGIDRTEFGSYVQDDSPAGRRTEEIAIQNRKPAVAEALAMKRKYPPGERFEYNTIDTVVLGWVLERATKTSITQFTTERLWKPLGAEADALWRVDGPSPTARPLSGHGFNAVLRDYGRLGLMMLNEGMAGERRIVSADWVRKSTDQINRKGYAPGKDPLGRPGDLRGYKDQWWTFTDSRAYYALGINGQYVYINPDTRAVIVKTSYFPRGDGQAQYDEADAFMRAASAWRPQP